MSGKAPKWLREQLWWQCVDMGRKLIANAEESVETADLLIERSEAARCEARDGYGDGPGRCALDVGHDGAHRSAPGETWD